MVKSLKGLSLKLMLTQIKNRQDHKMLCLILADGLLIGYLPCATIASFARVQIIGTRAYRERSAVNGILKIAEVTLFLHENRVPKCLSIRQTNTPFRPRPFQSVINNTPVPIPLSDAVANMKVIDDVFESAKEARWIKL